MTRPPVALLGLGIMGRGMAGRLLSAGFPLAVYNRTAEKAAPLVESGARLARSPRDAAHGASIVISMVSDVDASRRMWLGDDGALAGVARGTILVESSTLTVDWIRELASAAEARGCDLLEAPVTGSRTQAAAGDLLFLVGGSARTLDAARPVLSSMSRAIVHVGPTGSAMLLKLVNNFLCGVQAAALAEAMALIERGGLERDAALNVLTNGAPGSPIVRSLSQRMTSRDYTPNFHLALMAKDLAYAAGEGERLGVSMSTAQTALAAFRRAAELGYANDDVSAVVEPLRERASNA